MRYILTRKPFSSLTFLATIIGISLVGPLLIFGVTIGLTYLIPNFSIDSTFLTLFFLVGCTFYNIFLLLMIGVGHIEDGDDVAHFFSILVPARNEENVIEQTLEHIFDLDYPSELFEVIIVNDGSFDRTCEIVRDLQQKYPNLKLMNISHNNGGIGKSSALNTAFADFLITWRGIEIQPKHRWIIGVFDADAIPDANMLKKVSFQFKDPKVGGVQTLVRIRNRMNSLLTKMQDLEFLTFSRVVQFARTVFKGSVALGGNGQFIRATALDSIAVKDKEEYWKKDALTEDLDIGVRLIINKWENRYIDSSNTQQEGVENWRAIFHQRERWSWGHLQTLVRYVFSFKFWKSKIDWKTKVDVGIYLFYILIPFLIMICWIWSALSFFDILSLRNIFPIAFTLANGFSFLPLMGFGLWKQRSEYPVWQMIPLLFVAIAYMYHWIPCVTSALIKMILRVKPVWKKTPRFNGNGLSLTVKKPSREEGEQQIVVNS